MSFQNEIMFETDGRHSSVYLYEPPMGERQYVECIDEIVDLGIDTISYVVGDCAVLLYDTKVGEIWGHNVDLADHTVWLRAAQNVKSMIDRGIDPLTLVCNHAHKRGFKFIPHLLLNMVHTPHGRVTDCRVADFTTDHPEWQVGPEPDFPEAKDDQPKRLSYAIDEVRENRIAVIKELLFDYDSDGIELNFYTYSPFIARKEVEEHTSTLTNWLTEIRNLATEASKIQKREKRIFVRIGASLKGNLLMGHDIETWIKNELVDVLVAMPVKGDFGTDISDLQQIINLTKNSQTKVIAGIDSVSSEQTPKVQRAAIANVYDAGAKGCMYHRYYPEPNRYPYSTEDTNRLRFLAYPDLVEHMDKIFHMGPSKDRAKSEKIFGVKPQLPRILSLSEQPTPINIYIADDIQSKLSAGELWKCELRIMINNLMQNGEVSVVWNDKKISPENIRWADWIFQMKPRPDYVRGYRLHIPLMKDLLPQKGQNTISISLESKDPQLVLDIEITDIDLAVEYLPHKNAIRDDEEYSGGSLFTP